MYRIHIRESSDNELSFYYLRNAGSVSKSGNSVKNILLHRKILIMIFVLRKIENIIKYKGMCKFKVVKVEYRFENKRT